MRSGWRTRDERLAALRRFGMDAAPGERETLKLALEDTAGNWQGHVEPQALAELNAHREALAVLMAECDRCHEAIMRLGPEPERVEDYAAAAARYEAAVEGYAPLRDTALAVAAPG